MSHTPEYIEVSVNAGIKVPTPQIKFNNTLKPDPTKQKQEILNIKLDNLTFPKGWYWLKTIIMRDISKIQQIYVDAMTSNIDTYLIASTTRPFMVCGSTHITLKKNVMIRM